MTDDENPKALADEMERTADALEEKGDQVTRGIDQARTDVARKSADGTLPGASPEDETPAAEAAREDADD